MTDKEARKIRQEIMDLYVKHCGEALTKYLTALLKEPPIWKLLKK